MKKSKQFYTVHHPICLSLTTEASSPQSACRKAFRFWIKQGALLRQPKTTDDGEFEGIEIEILT